MNWIQHPLLWLFAAFGCWLFSIFNPKKGEAAGWAAALSYVIVLVIASSELARAAKGPPYWPHASFWLGTALFALFTFRNNRHAFLPSVNWKQDGHSERFPFSRMTLAFLIAWPCVVAALQYAYLYKRIHWGLPVIAWAIGVYVLLRTFYSWRDADSSSSSELQLNLLFTTGSVSDLDEDSEEENEGGARTQAWANTAAIGLLLLAAALYLILPTAYPTEVHGDEGEVALQAIAIRNHGDWNPFTPAWFKIPQLFFLIPGWGMWLFGDSLFGARTTAGLIGVVNVGLCYLVARRLFRPTPAILAMFLFLSCSSVIQYMRLGIGYNQAALFYLATFYCFLRGVQERSLSGFAWAGVVAALGWLSYQPCKLLPFLLVGSFALMAITQRSAWRRWAMGFATFVIAFWVGFAPNVGNYLHDPGAIFFRLQQVSLLSEHAQLGRYDNGTASSFRRMAMAPFTQPDLSPFYTNFHSGGMLDPLVAVLFAAGALYLLLRFWKSAPLLILFWTLATVLVGGALTIAAPAYQRMVGIMPFLAFIAAPPLHAMLLHVSETWRWGPKPRAVVTALVLALCLGMSVNRYFHVVMGKPQMHEDSTRVARFIDEIGPHAFVYFFGLPHYRMQYGNIRFLAQHTPGETVESVEAFFEKPIQRRGPVCFILIRTNRTHLDRLREMYPGGRELHHRDVIGNELFISYQVDL
ncbi:MAG: glycosyltransferase family 39 protein [Candidatus Hinthialibacter antarcticus]|nr:glycosyltransferase family 39 protein [Candidatus Hinthialibacter antarcticus]